MKKKIEVTRFAMRQFSAIFKGTKVVGVSAKELVEFANEALEAGAVLENGYAPFCKHLFVPNHSQTKSGVARITAENRHMLRSDYVARREGELPVLQRWFEGLAAPRAKFLDIILYSREQLEKEDDGKPEGARDVPDAEWGIVAINGGLQAAESPMAPATMVRNALGVEEGGSGVPLDRVAYAKSVAYWAIHALVE